MNPIPYVRGQVIALAVLTAGAGAFWSGDLSVPFLGVGIVPLTGEGWTARLLSSP